MNKSYLFIMLLIPRFYFGMETDSINHVELLPEELQCEIIKNSIYVSPKEENYFYKLLKQIYKLRLVSKQWCDLIDNNEPLNKSLIELLAIAECLYVIKMNAQKVQILTKGLEAWAKQSAEEDKKRFLGENNNVNEHWGFCLQLGIQQKKIEDEIAKIEQVNKISSDINIFAAIALGTPAAIKLVKEKIGDEKYKQALQIYKSKPSDLEPSFD